MDTTKAPKFIPDDQAENYFGKVPKFISDSEADSYFGATQQPDAIDTQIAELSKRGGTDYATGEKMQTPQTEQPGFFKGLYNDTVGNLFINPAVRLGETVGVGLVGAFGTPEQYNKALNVVRNPKEIAGATVLGQKPLFEGGATQIVGEALKTGANLYGGQGTTGIVKNVFKTPVARTIAESATIGGVGGGLYGTGSAIQNEDNGISDIAKETVKSALAGAVFGGGIGAVGAGGAKLLQKAKPDSAKIMQRQAKLTNTQEVKFKQMTGEDVGEFLSKRDLNRPPEEIVNETSKRFIDSYNEADFGLAQLPGKYKFEPIKTVLNDLAEREKLIATPGTKSENSGKIASFIEKYNKDGLDMSEINEIKRIYEREVRLPYLRENNSIQAERAGRIDNAIREWQFNKADDLGFKNLREINKQTQAYKFLSDKIAQRLTGIKTNNALSLTDIILLSGGDAKAVAQFAVKRLFSSARLQSLVAKIARDKNLDVNVVKALFGETKGLPAKIPGVDYTPARPTGLETKYKQINLPEQVRAVDLGLNEIKNAKQGQQLSQELLQKQSYTKDMIRDIASQVEDVLNGLPRNDKADLLEVLRGNKPEVYKEVIETQNINRNKAYQQIKGLPMSEKMQSIYEPYTPVEDLPVIKMGNKPKKVDTSGLPEIQMNDTIPINAPKTMPAKKPFVNKQGGFISTGSKDLQPLYKEAQKYKSAEDFVNNATELTYKNLQENPYSIKAYGKDFNEPVEYYRAGEIRKNGDIWLTDNEAGAKQYSQAGGGTKVGSYIVQSKKPLIIDTAGGKYAKGNVDINKILTKDEIQKGYTNNPDIKQKFIQYAKDNGYDSVQFADSFPDGEGGMRSLVVFDKTKIKTKSQLEQIWKEANGKVSTKQGMSAVNPLTVIGGGTAIGAGIMSKKESK